MEAARNEDVATASAFSKGKNQAISNTAVLNAGGNIIYLEWNPATIGHGPHVNGQEHDSDNNMLRRTLDAMSETLSSIQRPLVSTSLARVHAEPPSTPHNKFQTAAELEENDANTADGSINNGTTNSHDYTCSALGLSITPRSQSTVTLTDSQKPAFLPSERLEQAPSSCEVYTEAMFPLKYGYPLWLPEPDRNLPVEYRRTGVSAGDLGIITPDGGFDYIFNIGHSADDPINPDDLPEDFAPLPLPKSGISFQTLFNTGAHVSNMEITADEDLLTKNTSYNCKVLGKGALLSLPLGACQENAKNLQRIKDHISANALRWYNYALDTGRELDRHSLYLVTGSVKSQAWGIATFDKDTAADRDSTLVMGMPEPGFTSNRPPFTWKKSGGASSFRAGPTPDVLLPNDLVNQCLFLRGFKISLSETTWDSISKTRSKVITNEYGKRPFAPDGSDEGRAAKKSRNDEDESRGENSNNYNIGNSIHVSITPLPSTSQVFHPLDRVNELLFSQVHEARIVITHDDIWTESNVEISDVNRFVRVIKDDHVVGFCDATKTCTLESRSDILARLWDKDLHSSDDKERQLEASASKLYEGYDPEGTPELYGTTSTVQSPDVLTNPLTTPEIFNASRYQLGYSPNAKVSAEIMKFLQPPSDHVPFDEQAGKHE